MVQKEGKNMKNIGIMTWYYGANYGALAQSLALYKTIQPLGYDCRLINYKPKTYLKTIKNTNLPSNKELYKVKRVINGIIKIKNLSTTQFFKTTKRVHSAEEINKLELDCIVFGSDAIFNVKHPLCDDLYYGVGIKCRKVTYSPSCEFLNPDYELSESYKKSLNEMTSISVRDTNTYMLVRNNTGLVPQITLDPTFLYDFHDIDKKICKSRYMLVYAFSSWDEYCLPIIKYAKEHKLKILCLGQELKWADKSVENATFEEWITAFRHADCVVTDSFHGTVFSLKNKKQIVLCGRNDKKAKIASLLHQFDIDISIYNGENLTNYLAENRIDYSEKQKNINYEIEKSMKYLRQALK